MMFKFFYHVDRGTWATVGFPSADILAAYPEGTVEIPSPDAEGMIWNPDVTEDQTRAVLDEDGNPTFDENGAEITETVTVTVGAWESAPVVVSDADIFAERDRRIVEGRVFTVGSNDVRLSGRQQVQSDLVALATAAQVALATGEPASFNLADEDGVEHDLTPTEILTLYMQAVQWIEAVKRAARDLSKTLPTDYADDAKWP